MTILEKLLFHFIEMLFICIETNNDPTGINLARARLAIVLQRDIVKA